MPTLLMVDDCQDLLAVRKIFFRQMGFEVIAYSDPLDALQALPELRVSVIVTDYDMPEIDGIAFSERARLSGFAGPIILSTGCDNVPAYEPYLINNIVKKAMGPQCLLDAVVSYLTAEDQGKLSTQRNVPIRKETIAGGMMSRAKTHFGCYAAPGCS